MDAMTKDTNPTARTQQERSQEAVSRYSLAERAAGPIETPFCPPGHDPPAAWLRLISPTAENVWEDD